MKKQYEMINKLTDDLFEFMENIDPDTDEQGKKMLRMFLAGWLIDNEARLEQERPAGGNLR